MSTPRILIVDDDSNVVRILARTFETSGYQVAVARNGQEAYETITRTDPFHAMICDIQMPRLTGRELCQKLAAQGPYLPATIVIVTSRSEAEERDWVHAIPCIHLIEKPVGPRQLLRTVQGHLAPSQHDHPGLGDERRAA
jgi:two-component system, chemotaxis family, sensor histidine kinase and response regulator PixL